MTTTILNIFYNILSDCTWIIIGGAQGFIAGYSGEFLAKCRNEINDINNIKDFKGLSHKTNRLYQRFINSDLFSYLKTAVVGAGVSGFADLLNQMDFLLTN